jgi:hypothetical protein
MDSFPHPFLKPIPYSKLNARQQENYNNAKLASVLADFGFITHRLSDDWKGADLIAQHIKDDVFLKVQLKGRLTFQKSYQGKNIWVAFRKGDDWYLYPHDEMVTIALTATGIAKTKSWRKAGGYSFPGLPKALLPFLSKYRIQKP